SAVVGLSGDEEPEVRLLERATDDILWARRRRSVPLVPPQDEVLDVLGARRHEGVRRAKRLGRLLEAREDEHDRVDRPSARLLDEIGTPEAQRVLLVPGVDDDQRSLVARERPRDGAPVV